MIPITKNITVLSPDGTRLNDTYPKRARGLLNKGRASVTAPDTITLTFRPPGTEDFMKNSIDKPAEASEIAAEGQAIDVVNEVQTDEIIPDAQALVNRYRGIIIEFEPRKWKPNPDIQTNNKTNRSYFTAENGELRELWQLGDWNWNWSEIITGDMRLETNTEYRIIFWLKDGKNLDGRDCVCRLEITFDGDYENRNIYDLSKGFVKPLLTKDEWMLFCIPFNTGGSERFTLRFAAQHAPIFVKPAIYDELTGIFPDKPPEKIETPTPKLDFSGLAGIENDSDEIIDRIFDYMNNPALPSTEKMQMMGMIQGIIGQMS
jgi:hypothetical protein